MTRVRLAQARARTLTMTAYFCIVLTLPNVADASAGSAVFAEPSVSWLSAGDSYSSGEGVPGAGVDRRDVCARSTKAFGPLAAEILRRSRDWKIEPLVFPACTGAVISDFYTSDQKRSLGAQATTARGRLDGRYDVVTMSFGGNDVDFAGIVTDCIQLPITWENALDVFYGCGFEETELDGRVANLIAGKSTHLPRESFVPSGRKGTLADFYAAVAQDHLQASGVLAVVGYPRLLAPSAQWPTWRNGTCAYLSRADADMLGRSAEKLDREMRQAVRSAQKQVHDGKRLIFISLLDAYDDKGHSHSLCASDIEWLNGVAVVTRNGEIRKQRSFHPNEVGHQATAQVVAAYVGEHLQRVPAPDVDRTTQVPETSETAEETPEPLTDGGQLFGVGDAFAATCSVAWPTAPTYTANSIIMTMYCPDVPQQFLFVQVSYPDPDLPINPSTGSVSVRGVVVDVATSGYGPKTLIVRADTVAIP